MLLVALLAVPLVAAGLLARLGERAAHVVHAAATIVTAALAVAVSVAVVRQTTIDTAHATSWRRSHRWASSWAGMTHL